MGGGGGGGSGVGGNNGQLSVKRFLMINYETYQYIFDAKFSLTGTYNVNLKTLQLRQVKRTPQNSINELII